MYVTKSLFVEGLVRHLRLAGVESVACSLRRRDSRPC